MTTKLFFRQLGILSISVAIGISCIHHLALYHLGKTLSWASFIFFIFFSMSVFALSKRSVASLNPQLFTQVFLGSTIIKLIFSLGLVLIFKEDDSVASKLYILPFMGIYLIYTVFEIYFLSKIAKE